MATADIGRDRGLIYVLSNLDFSLAKVGLTRNGTPDARADAYSRTHGIEWHVFWTAPTLDVGLVEARAHRALEDRRFSHVAQAREIFHVTPETARAVAQRYVIQPPGASPFPTPPRTVRARSAR